jgi:hypothetical protein
MLRRTPRSFRSSTSSQPQAETGPAQHFSGSRVCPVALVSFTEMVSARSLTTRIARRRSRCPRARRSAAEPERPRSRAVPVRQSAGSGSGRRGHQPGPEVRDRAAPSAGPRGSRRHGAIRDRVDAVRVGHEIRHPVAKGGDEVHAVRVLGTESTSRRQAAAATGVEPRWPRAGSREAAGGQIIGERRRQPRVLRYIASRNAASLLQNGAAAQRQGEHPEPQPPVTIPRPPSRRAFPSPPWPGRHTRVRARLPTGFRAPPRGAGAHAQRRAGAATGRAGWRSRPRRRRRRQSS